MDEFNSIAEDSNAEIEEKKSKFIAHVFYVEKVEEAEKNIREIKKKYFDARHNCYAYRVIEENGIREKQSDDGEPSGTAGAPMLSILQKNNLLNVLVVVTRYFGGTLLGTGGLIRAYSEATLKSIENSGIIKMKKGCELEVAISYSDFEKFKYYCDKRNIEIKKAIYGNEIQCLIDIENGEKEKIIDETQRKVNILSYSVLKEKYIKENIK